MAAEPEPVCQTQNGTEAAVQGHLCNLGLEVRRGNRPRPENAAKLHSALRYEIAKRLEAEDKVQRYEAAGQALEAFGGPPASSRIRLSRQGLSKCFGD